MYTPKGEVNDKLIDFLMGDNVNDKFTGATNPDDFYAVVVENGVEISKEEFVEGMSIIKSVLEEREAGILSEEDLESVAGGKVRGDRFLFWFDIVTTLAPEIFLSAAS